MIYISSKKYLLSSFWQNFSLRFAPVFSRKRINTVIPKSKITSLFMNNFQQTQTQISSLDFQSFGFKIHGDFYIHLFIFSHLNFSFSFFSLGVNEQNAGNNGSKRTRIVVHRQEIGLNFFRNAITFKFNFSHSLAKQAMPKDNYSINNFSFIKKTLDKI